MKKQKKAMVGVQFNWIFVFIAGACILGFFIMIINSYNERQDQKLALELSQNLDTIIKSAKSTSGLYKEIEISESRLDFECDKDYSAFMVSKPGPFDPLWTEDSYTTILFSPRTLEGRQLYALTLNWKAPFPVTPFLYLTNDRAMYYFINDSNGYVEELYKLMPDGAAKELIVDIDDFEKDNGFLLYVVVFDKNDLSDVSNKITVLAPRFVGVGFDSGGSLGVDGPAKVYFYGNSWSDYEESYFYMREMLLGAVFSEDKSYYECNLLKSFDRYNLIRTLNYDRLSMLLLDTRVSDKCVSVLTAAQIAFPVNDAGIDNLQDSFTGIEYSAERLRNLNDDLIRSNCPYMY